jgi:hypothetical protein
MRLPLQVCCIDEGMPMPGCRQILSYGAADMDVFLHTLLHRHRLTPSLPTALAAAPSYRPAVATQYALRALRHGGCSLLLNHDPQETPSVDLPNSGLALGAAPVPEAAAAYARAAATALATATSADAARKAVGDAADAVAALAPVFNEGAFAPTAVRVQLGSLGQLPPLLLFAPSVAWALQRAVGFERPHGATSVGTQVDHSDVFDDEFLNESALERALPAGMTPAQPKETFVGAANFAPSLTSLGARHSRGLTPEAFLGYMPLDEAIVRAVERGKSTEVKRRLYGTILLIGGAAHTPGLAEYLEWRVACGWKLAEDSTEGIERIEVTKLPLGTDPESLAWHGAATLPELESGPALWILREEWMQRGALAAREVCAFSW